MVALKYIGAKPTQNPDIVIKEYITSLLTANLPQGTVDTLIAAGLVPYATKVYTDAQDALNADAAYIDVRDSIRLHQNQINDQDGVAGLDVTGKVDISRITAASTQRWPKTYISPIAYNVAAVPATVETTLYPCAVPDPGFPYKLLITGLVDTKTAVDGQFPEVFVRKGSVTGEIVAFGYGSTESYQGLVPGATQSQMWYSGSQTPAKATWQTLAGWVAVNVGGYTSTMNGNFLQVMQTQTNGTLSASIGFSGMGVPRGAQIRIINSANAVIGTGALVTAASGICTVSATRTLTLGELYTVQGWQDWDPGIIGFGAGNGGPWASGATNTLTVGGATTGNASEVVLIPSPFTAQTVTTGATTLYVMLRSSDAVAQVTASTFQPRLHVTQVPA